ncbi:hypothetical protein BJ166DRAFT_578001 [Pestalotiopsis sp. NC0098]|nr:hypothetical protein BJ166DRAFT_578001 [Pestalotiopsis sp. NC0098]
MSSVKLSSGRDHQAGGGRVSIVGDVGIGRDSRRFGPVVIPPEPSVVPVLFLLPREGRAEESVSVSVEHMLTMSKAGPSKPLRLLAPAPTLTPSDTGGRSAGETVSSESVMAPRRMLVKNACSNCKVKKTKCDGKRPRCTRCDTRKLACVFETLYEGMTKQESAEFEIARLQGIIADLNAKFHVLKHGSHDQAQSMLASIRQQGQNTDDDDEWSQLPDPLNNTVPPACSSSELSDVFEEHEFLPLLFNRREWTRGPSSNDDDTNTEFFAVPGIENLEHSVDQLPIGLESDSTPRQSNNFKNLPFSSAILANHFPPDIQQQQHANVFQPLWSILPLATLPGAQSVKDSVSNTIQQARLLIQSGQSLDQVAGKSCNLGAILDHDQYKRATLLSQWAARIVFSVQRRSPEFVVFASTSTKGEKFS